MHFTVEICLRSFRSLTENILIKNEAKDNQAAEGFSKTYWSGLTPTLLKMLVTSYHELNHYVIWSVLLPQKHHQCEWKK